MGRVQAPMMATTTCPWLTCFSRALNRTGSFQHLWRESISPYSTRECRLLTSHQTRQWRLSSSSTSTCRTSTTCRTGSCPALSHSPNCRGSPVFSPIRFHSSSSWTFQQSKQAPSSHRHRQQHYPDRNRRARTRRRPISPNFVHSSVVSRQRLGRKFRRFVAVLKHRTIQAKRGRGISVTGSSSSSYNGIHWNPRREQLVNRETRLLLHQFEIALQRRDVRQAYDQYLFLRQQSRSGLCIGGVPFLTSRLWMDLQLNFLRLLYMHEHQTALRASLSSPIAAATGLFRWTNSSFSVPSFQKLPGRVHGVITEIQRRQNRLYEDMLVTTFHDYPGTAALARSLAQSLSVLGRTDVRGGAIKKDWREALRPLEEWSRLYRQVDVAGEDTSSTMSSATHNGAPPSLLTPIHPHMAKRLGQHLELLMKKLVYTHTALISQIFDSMETRFGIPPSFDMHMTMLRHYAHFGYQEGSAEALRIVKSMNDRQLPWQETSEVYDLLLSSMSRRAGWRNEIRLLVDTMLANGILPKEETMHAAMLCAARSGDVMACSKYLERMHREWGLTPSERLKSILLYACAKRGDFQGAVEVFGQLMDHGHLTWTRSQEAHKRGGQGKDGGSRREEPYDHVLKGIKETEAQGNLDNALVNQSNLLLALINQSMAASKGRRRDHRQDRALIQEEVRSILRLFTMITNPSHPYAASTKVDSHLYTILMQYLSTLPSPLQGMRHLYEEMLKKNETKPNLVTYKILLDACAEQMDMESGQAYWNDMLQQGILPNKHVRASYVKGWCNVGEFAKAEESCRDALQFSLSTSDDAVEKARQVLQRQIQARIQTLSDSIGNSNMDTIQLRRLRSIRKRWMNERMILRQLARQQAEAFDISVVDTLMQGYVRHDMWHQACRVYEAVEQGLWGNTSRPTPKMLMTFFYCCGQGGFVQRAIDTFTRIESKVNGATAQQHPQRQVRPQHKKLMADKDGIEGGETMTSETMLPEMEWAQLLTDGTFFHYFGVLGRSHRAELLIPAWKSLLNLGIHPSQRTVGRLLDCLEDQQWGLGAIKQIQQDLTDNWPDQDWSHIIGDRSGGRLWR